MDKNILYKKFFCIDVWFMRVLKIYNKMGNYYLSVKRIPKFDGRQKIDYIKERVNDKDVAIVIQGPLMMKNDFTYNTVRLYKQMFSNAIIIVSTWETEPEEELKKYEKLGVKIIKSSLPQNMGCSNVNAQLKSTREGILFAKECGAKYIMKIRTDWRINYPYAFNFMKQLIIREKECCGFDKLIVVDNYHNRTESLPPFLVCDFFYFGQIDNMLKIAEIPENDCPYKDAADYAIKNNHNIYPSFKEQCKENIPPEYHIATNYLMNKGERGDFGDEEYYLECLRKYFIFISPWDIDAYWPKYDAVLEQPTSWVEAGERNKYTATQKMSYCDYLQYISEDKDE